MPLIDKQSDAKSHFQHIALIGRPGKKSAQTLEAVIHFLRDKVTSIAIGNQTATLLPNHACLTFAKNTLPNNIDLIIVIGGDGSLLNAAAISLSQSVPVLGINRGYLGFLTDIHPSEIDQIGQILEGNYQIESRFLLCAKYNKDEQTAQLAPALNDIVLLPGDEARMIAFDIFIDNQFVCHQRADGMIVATPTGSTAYALSGGGPILHPSLDAIALVPMFPHTLTSRPIVVSGNAQIKIKISTSNKTSPYLSADGRTRITLPPGSEISIQKHDKQLKLLHPNHYEYFKTLREKLGWEQRTTSHTKQ